MSLSGYTRTNERKNGGIRLLGLICNAHISSVSHIPSAQVYSAVNRIGNTAFAKYEFQEDEAEYTETVSLINGALVVTHEIKFLLDKMGPASLQVVQELSKASFEGIVAIVLTHNGDTFLCGYSVEMEQERPLRLKSVTSTTGKGLKGSTHSLFTLQSQDISRALPFGGDIYSLF